MFLSKILMNGRQHALAGLRASASARRQASTAVHDLLGAHQVSDSEASALLSFFQDRLTPYNPYHSSDEIAAVMNAELKDVFSLPSFSHDFVRYGYPAAMLIRGLPIDGNLPNTPEVDEPPADKTFVSENVLLALATLLDAHVYVNEGEKNDSHFHNVMHLAGNEDKKRGDNELRGLGWHIENIHDELPPDFITLLALRGDINAITKFIFVDEILGKLPKGVIEGLAQPDFRMKTGDSYHVTQRTTAPVLEWDEEAGWLARFNISESRCKPLTCDAKKALAEFKAALFESTAHGVCLDEGDALVLNNRKILHDRTGFIRNNTYEERRWLQRAYMRKNSALMQLVNGSDQDDKAESEAVAKEGLIPDVALDSFGLSSPVSLFGAKLAANDFPNDVPTLHPQLKIGGSGR